MSIVLLAIALVISFLPIVIAFKRDHPSKWGITALVFLFGWFFGLGWVFGLIWALSNKGQPQTIVINNSNQ